MSGPSAWIREAPLVIGHRGASAYAPENTLEAFRRAAQEGADAVELDAKLTADGRVVAFHDPTLERTTGTTGLLKDRTFDELRRLDAGAWMGPTFRGIRIPALEEVFEEFRGRLLFNVELSNYWAGRDGLVERVVALIQSMGVESQVLLSSFFRQNLAAAASLAPEIARGHLVGPTRLTLVDLWKGVSVQTQALHPYDALVSPPLVRRMHRRGRRVIVYTVEDPVRMATLWAAGVDGIISNDPGRLRSTVTG